MDCRAHEPSALFAKHEARTQNGGQIDQEASPSLGLQPPPDLPGA